MVVRARGRRPAPELAALRDSLSQLLTRLPTLSRQNANAAMSELLELSDEIQRARDSIDPIKDPGLSFDPSQPETAGRLVALALMAQDKVPLAHIARTYGSGVYAIYYGGDFPAYAAVSGSETPVYVGKADPQRADAVTSREQGPQLYGRLADHRKMISTVGDYALSKHLPNPLKVSDFSCRRLVCATNAQLVAERHLISTFKPIWNSEVGICWGICKHGDSASRRSNRRSPWDVMHPGRLWAMAEELEDKMSAEFIMRRIGEHLAEHPPKRDRAEIVAGFLKAFSQLAGVSVSASQSDRGVADASGSDTR